MYEFQLVTGFAESKLLHNFRCLLTYAQSITKKEMKKLIGEYFSLTEYTDGTIIMFKVILFVIINTTVAFGIAVASLLTMQKGKGKPTIFKPFIVSACNTHKL